MDESTNPHSKAGQRDLRGVLVRSAPQSRLDWTEPDSLAPQHHLIIQQRDGIRHSRLGEPDPEVSDDANSLTPDYLATTSHSRGAPQEKQYYDTLFSTIDKEDTGAIPGQAALPFLVSSNLPQQTLGEVWSLADPDNNGFLTQQGWYNACRIIGWLQKGGKTVVEESLAKIAGPYPTFSGHPPPPAQPSAAGPMSPMPTGSSLPPLTQADRTKFTRIFVGCGPSNGLVTGEKARDVFVKSQLPYEKLGQIWNLADTQQRGSLDLPDFIIGMYLIQSCMASSSLSLPPVLPAGTYEAASGGRPPPPALPSSPIARQNTGGASPVRAQYTGGMLQAQRTGQSITAQPLGHSTPPKSSLAKTFSPPASSTFSSLPSSSSFGAPSRQGSTLSQPWDVTPQAKATSDGFFAQLDPEGKGVIEGEVAVPFMLQSQLDEGSLASIWDLADIRREGKLTKEEFAVAMHLINAKLAGQNIPATIPDSLVPPSLREQFGSGGQEVLATPASTSAKDLFDLFDDPPTAISPPAPQAAFAAPSFLPAPPSRQGSVPPSQQRSAQLIGQRAISPATTGQQPQSGFGMQPFAPPPSRSQPPADLLGDDSPETVNTAVPDNSAEIGNKQNQLANTTRSNDELAKTRGELEKTAATAQAQLDELEEKLVSARSKHDEETKLVADLRARVSEQKNKMQRLNEDTIAAESDLSGMRSEKDELGQSLMRDKEEVRGLQKRMKEIEDEKTGLKLLLEKLRKEARQQKGMVSIAKKQLSTVEGSRDTVQQDIRTEERAIEEAAAAPEPVAVPIFSPTNLSTASGVPLPRTPQSLSPAPTGTSTRSNNPFDRLVKPRAQSPAPPVPTEEPSSPLGSGTILGGAAAAVGVVAAGATSLFTAAKEAVVGEDTTPDKPVEEEKESDPFGASPVKESKEIAPAANMDSDPFGVPSTAAPTVSAFDSEFESGFGDSFTAPAEPAALKEGLHLAPSSEPNPPPLTDFDSAFADFDKEPEETVAPVSSIPSGIPKSALPDLKPEMERTDSTRAVAPTTPPATITPLEPFDDSPAPAPAQQRVTAVDEDLSSDEEEEEGPEDLEAPKQDYKGKSRAEGEVPTPAPVPTTTAAPLPPVLSLGLAPPITSPTEDEASPRIRRSAPPPPPSSRPSVNVPASQPLGGGDEFDPFGAPAFAPSAAAIPAAPKTGGFDDEDDFDFSDLPPATVDHSAAVHNVRSAAPSSAFEDEFAGFDDDFEKPSSHENNSNSSNTFEMVSPHPGQEARLTDEWGLGAVPAPAAAPAVASKGFSFDDAFGGEFEPTPAPAATETYAAPSGPPPSSLKPGLPERRPSQAQPDDIDDVKKLCAMGFSRALVIDALDANGYDLQKTLNVLLAEK
ncbi:epidermal growth factor receptor substrate 15, partial [Tremellales sp. Uapishka_1]